MKTRAEAWSKRHLTDAERVKWWRRRMRDWALVWRKRGWPLAIEHAIQNRDLAHHAAIRAQQKRPER